MTTTNHSFISSGLTSIDPRVLLKLHYCVGGTVSPYLRHWVGGTVLFHLLHRVGGTSIYKSEGYSVRRVSGMIQDDKGGQESDDKDLGG